MPLSLILVRHGRTGANAAGLLQGRADNPLDEEGRRQVDAVARLLGSVDVVVSSPLLRARQTADVLDGTSRLVDARWVELDYGDLDGVPVADVPPETWARWRRDVDFRVPNGETFRELDTRVRSACESLVGDMGTNATVVVASHVSPIKAAIGWALGADASVSWRTRLDAGSVSRVDVGPNGPVLRSFNETGHLHTSAR